MATLVIRGNVMVITHLLHLREMLQMLFVIFCVILKHFSHRSLCSKIVLACLIYVAQALLWWFYPSG
jgi:hypothetical protein